MAKNWLRILALWWRAVRDPHSPKLLKWLPLIALGYVVLPIDGLPDLLPLIGQMDDLAVVVGTVYLVARQIPPAAWEAARRSLTPPPAVTPPAAGIPEARSSTERSRS